ncbi:discoidin domain-containing protein [Streptomyces canarius]|uniref:F5/8 type C domain-containing protein n=1 Tax=Streptomyces canarius TaxID=285453 RepID=A0ABQ3DB22_9ACTN|nr:discoidin domain-containing protein [Streptomyces canarius]GHA74183.1 hypothetical protein GCM10010345_90930 [Streptomyces canarius]
MAYADSQESVGESAPASNVLDGDLGTFWHTQWSGPRAPMPHEIQLNLGGDNKVSCLYYLPRQDSANGRIVNYEVYTSKDGTAWGNPVATGTWTNTSAEGQACFTPVSAHSARCTAIRGPRVPRSTSARPTDDTPVPAGRRHHARPAGRSSHPQDDPTPGTQVNPFHIVGSLFYMQSSFLLSD